MKHLLLFIVLFSPVIGLSQPDTDVFVASIVYRNDSLFVSQLRNLSDNPGYDNQPSWFDNTTLLYGRNVDGSTEIARVSLDDPDTEVLPYQTTAGGEYSPQRFGPDTDDVLAIRLDPDGYQGLYRYSADGSKSKELIIGLRMAYFVKISPDQVIGSVLSDGRLDLVKADFGKSRIDTLIEGSGRSIHLRPGKQAVSYTATSEDTDGMDLFQMDLASGESFYIKDLPLGVQDYTWLDGDRVLIGSGPRLFVYDLFEGGKWKQVANLEGTGIEDITRMAISPDGKRLAFVAETGSSPELVVQTQLEAYNNRDIDAFMATYSMDIELYNFPDELQTEGQEEMRKSYKAFFDSTPDLHCKIVNRIVMGNKVIDQELVTVNGNQFSAVAVYEVIDGKIVKVTFIR